MGTKYLLYFDENGKMVFNETPDRPLLRPFEPFDVQYLIVGAGARGGSWNGLEGTQYEGGYGGGSAGGMTTGTTTITSVINNIIIGGNTGSTNGERSSFNGILSMALAGDGVGGNGDNSFFPNLNRCGGGINWDNTLPGCGTSYAAGGGAGLGGDGGDADSSGGGIGGDPLYFGDSFWGFTDLYLGRGGSGGGMPGGIGQTLIGNTNLTGAGHEIYGFNSYADGAQWWDSTNFEYGYFGNGGGGGFGLGGGNFQGGYGSKGLVVVKYEGTPKAFSYAKTVPDNLDRSYTIQKNGWTYHIFTWSGQLIVNAS